MRQEYTETGKCLWLLNSLCCCGADDLYENEHKIYMRQIGEADRNSKKNRVGEQKNGDGSHSDRWWEVSG